MATKKTASSGAKRSTTRHTRRTTTRRTTRGALTPRRRASRPGLPTTVGAALGTLVVTTMLDLPWPMRLGLIAVVLVVGLAYVVWKHRAQVAAGAEGAAPEPDAAATPPTEAGASSAQPPEPLTDPS